MNFLSKTEYENQINPYKLTNKLFQIGLLYVYFAKAVIYIAKYSQYLIPEKDKKVCLDAIEIAEKYLRGEATKEECNKAADAAYLIASTNAAVSSTLAAAYAVKTSADAAICATKVIETSICAAKAAETSTYAIFKVYIAEICGSVAKGSADIAACGVLRQAIPWELVCATQIVNYLVKASKEESKERMKKRVNLIEKFVKDKNLINYATIILEDENLRKEFKFLMKDYVNK